MASAALVSARILAPVVLRSAIDQRTAARADFDAAVAAQSPAATIRAARAEVQVAHGMVISLSSVDRLVLAIT